MPIRFKPDAEAAYQHHLFPSNVFDLLSEDHDCFIFKDLIDQMDTSEIEAGYSPQGQHPYHPKKILGILIYGYSHGVFSSRQLEKRCNEDLGFMYIAGMKCPNFRVLSDFRKEHGEFFRDCFKQTVQLALEMKLASLGHVSLDGSYFKANSSKHKAMSYRYLKEKEQALMEQIEGLIEQATQCDKEEDAEYGNRSGEELPKELKFKQQRLKTIREAKAALEAREQALNPGQVIDDKKQISFSDTEARIMGKGGKDYDYRYNGQISVDGDHQMIVGQHVSQQSNDQHEVEAALEQIEQASGRKPDQMSLDNGYFSGENLTALEKAEIDAYVAVGRGEKPAATALEPSDRKLIKADFCYEENDDVFRCPNGQVLVLKSQNAEGKRVYQGEIAICQDCPLYQRCCTSKKGQARTITSDAHEAVRRRMRDKMAEEDSKAIYKRRKSIVEPVFGQTKNGGFCGFSVRGKEKVSGEFSLVCAAHNLKKMAKAIATGLVGPEFRKMRLQGA